MKLFSDDLKKNKEEILNDILEFQMKNRSAPFYIIPDFVDDSNGKKIASVFKNLQFVTGGSGLALFLAKEFSKKLHKFSDSRNSDLISGPSLILAGSCSIATKEQVAFFKEHGGNTLILDPVALLEKTSDLDSFITRVLENESYDLLIHTTGNNPDSLKNDSGYDQKLISETLENAMASIAVHAVEAGCRRMIIAGGETSGAVTKALEVDAYYPGESVTPGVPVLTPCNKLDFRLILKSGNFGNPDFFIKAIRKTV